MPKATIRNKVRSLRFANGEMTQAELAHRVGCTRQTIILLEQERYVPSLALALLLAKTFGVSVEEIFEFVEPPTGDSS